MFHVKHPSPRRRRRRCREVLAQAPGRPRQAERACPCPLSRRRTWRSRAMRAAGVMPGIRPAWPRVAGRIRLQLGPAFRREGADGAVVEPSRQIQGLVPAESQDVGLLPVEIAGIAAFDLELLGDRRRQVRQLGPEPGQLAQPHIRPAEKLEGRAPDAVLGDGEAGGADLAGAGAEAGQLRPRLGQGLRSWPRRPGGGRHRRSPRLRPGRSAADRHCRPAAIRRILGPGGEHAIGLVGARGSPDRRS